MMLDISLSCAGIPAFRLASRQESAPPPVSIFTIVIEGDSITSGSPSNPSGDFYSYRYADARDDLTAEVRAQGSRTVGAVLDDDGNTLMGNVAEDMAYEPDLVTALIGANDMALNSAAAYKANLASWYAAVKAERPECRVAWSAPMPYNPDESHVSYASFSAQRAVVMADARNPSVWGHWADYYLPLAEHPDWVELGSALYADGVHPTAFDAVNGSGGQNRIYDQFKPAVDTIADATRAHSTEPYESVWPEDEGGLAPGTSISRRFVVSGIAHAGIAGGVSVSGGDAEVRLNGGAYAANTSAASAWLYNGDVIDLRLTTSEEPEVLVQIALTIGSERREIAYQTVAESTPVSYVHGDILNVQPADTVHTFSNLNFEGGLAVLVTNSPTGNSGVVLTPAGGGMAINATRQLVDGGEGSFEVWTAAVAAGAYDVTLNKLSWTGQSTLSYGTVQNAGLAPVEVVHSAPANQSPPHLTPPVTVPANGLALVFFEESGGASITPATANAPTVLIDEGRGTFQSATFGIAIGSLAESGQGSFQYAFGTWARGALVFGAGG